LASLNEKESAELVIDKFKQLVDALRVHAHASKREEFLTLSQLIERLRLNCARLMAMGLARRVSM
jgi:hypothetical protein